MYTREAHASDGHRPARHVEIAQPKTWEERTDVAKRCSAALDLKIPQLVDDMKDTIAKAFHGMPDRLFVLGADGKIAFRGERGPRGFDVAAMETALKPLVAPAK